MIKNKLNIGMRGHDISADNIEELAKKFNEYGLSSIQLVLKKSINGFSEGMFSPSFAKLIGKTFRNNNIDIPILGCYINPSCTDETELKAQTDYFIENLKYAKFMNAGVVGLETGFVGDTCIPENNHTEEAYQHLLRTMKYLTSEAEKLGVMIAVEAVNCFVIHSSETMQRLINDLNSPNICVIFDLLNLLTIDNYKNQTQIIKTAFDILGDKIIAVHLKDFKVEYNQLIQCPIGQGLLNIPLLLSAVKNNKPYLPIILEETNEEKITESMFLLTNKYGYCRLAKQ
ncbi:MAG: sugar phosphate isomerase/epimerase [Ruminococcus sp.]|nr:sugar phosphate isomerase/epimerase [Candidatus Copronaster equi]